MAVLKLPPPSAETLPTKRRRRKHHHSQNPKPKLKKQQEQEQKHEQEQEKHSSSSSSWEQIKNLLKCKQMDVGNGGSGQKIQQGPVKNCHGYSKLSSCRSICSFGDVSNGKTATRVVHRGDNSPENGEDSAGVVKKKKLQMVAVSDSSSSSLSSGGSSRALTKVNGNGSYVSSSGSRGMQLRKLSGCYECHAIIDPSRIAIPRSRICLCSECGEVFPKMESLEHHQAIRHAVSELGPEDSGRNIVEIIFKSSWQNHNHPIFTIQRILKVNNTRRTLQRFEDYRHTVKTLATATATATTSRCAADGNELLRFHCTTLACSLGSHGSSALCTSAATCGVCATIRHGFQSLKSGDGGGGGGRRGVCTTASSGRAHDCLKGGGCGVRAMLVCRVIAGKVKVVAEASAAAAEEEGGGMYDSVAGKAAGSYTNIEELYVYNPRAILPCFVVVYKAMESRCHLVLT